MMQKFISAVYFEGKLIAITELGDIWWYDFNHMHWTFMAYGPNRTPGI